MSEMLRWTVEIFIGEDDGRTYAEARLDTSSSARLIGVGHARLNPDDADVPEIGDELAAARALSDLGHRLLITSAADIQAITHAPVHLSG